MDKRALVAVILSMLVLLIWGYFEQKKGQERQILQKKLEMEVEKERVPEVEPEKFEVRGEGQEKRPGIKTLTDIPSYMSLEPPPVKEIVVENDLATITFTTLGGRLKSYVLKEYKDRDGNNLEMIPELEYRDMPLALDLRQEGGKLTTSDGREFNATLFNSRVNRAVYEASTPRIFLSSSRGDAKLSMSYHDGTGVKVIKEFTFFNDTYSFDVDVRLEGLARYPQGIPYQLTWGSALSEDKKRRGRQAGIQVLTFDGKKTKKRKAKKIKDVMVITEPVRWVSAGTKYFVVALLPGDTEAPAALRRVIPDKIAIGMRFNAGDRKAGTSPSLYVGPKESKRLARYGLSLEKVIDYGWTPFGETATRGLAKPLMAILRWFYSFTHNYGLAIILLTMVIKVAFYPLTQKSFISMQRMQVLQPKVKALQERYRNDRQRLNQEMMHLYRTHKANPMGGCLPMLAQLPIFYALYVVLMYSIELRQAPFIWWIKDLSDYDPYFVTPILMGVTMFFQQKMSPTMGDPRQAKMMLMMPVIFTIMFIYFPVGLVIYWLINNLLTIVQQFFIKKKMAVAPAKQPIAESRD